jgi:multidrug efflux system membrane fusion protein
MGPRRLAGAAFAIAAAAAAYSVYAPDFTGRFLPITEPAARRVHDALFAAKPAPAPTPTASAQASASKPAAVSVAAVTRADYPVFIDGLGQVQAENTVTVRTRVDGQVVKIAFKEGQTVKAGDLLAQIDPRPFEAALDQAKAKQAQDQATLANARLDLQRYSTLAKQSFATQQQLDAQNAQVNSGVAQQAADAAAIDAAQVQLDYATISAPISGRVGFRLVDEGYIVNASQQTGIVSIAQIEPISVVFTVPQDNLPSISAALVAGEAPIEARTSDGNTLLATGKLTVVDNQVDATTGTIRLKAEFANADHKLWPGQAVAVRLRVDVEKNALTIPDHAVQRGPNGLFVYVVGADNRATTRPVTLSHEDADSDIAVVAKGLSDGEKVVIGGQFGLQPGARVAIEANTASGGS